MNKTLFDKLWKMHQIRDIEGDKSLIYICKHLIHEVTSPLAFEGLKENKLKVMNPAAHFSVADHNVPTDNKINKDPESVEQIQALKNHSNKHGIKYFELGSNEHGIVHVIAPELGITQPGISIVCGDSHTSTHGAFGALAFGIGTSDIEQVLATQTISMKKPKSMLVKVEGAMPKRVYTKDLALYFISKIGASGGRGYAIEYTGDAIDNANMDARMTLCNMGIEAGSQINLIAPDNTTLDYLENKESICKEHWNEAIKTWDTLKSDQNANFDKTVYLNISRLSPMTTWGTNLDSVISINDNIPREEEIDSAQLAQYRRSLDYMALQAGQKIKGLKIDRAFIGSCTNSRISDLREVAEIVRGKKISNHVRALVVPGSEATKKLAEQEGLHHIFLEAGFEWRKPGCSMCLGMNPDKLLPEERCASTSNRNFEGRQGAKGRTHLMSPAMVAAAAVAGEITDVRKL